MNPFSRTPSYDNTLADIVEGLGKHPIDIRVLRDLFAHLPNVDLETDLAAIKMGLKPLFRYTCPKIKRAANCILYKIIRRLGSAEELRDLECEWLYYNFDASDEYALKILSGSFDVRAVEREFYERISWDNPIRALACFVYLIERAADEYTFNVAELECGSNYIFDQPYRVLEVITARTKHAHGSPSLGSISEAMGMLSLDSKGAYFQLYHSILSRLVQVHSSLFVSNKYKILFNFYRYADSSVYEESRHFTDDNYRDLIAAADAAALAVPADGNLLHSDSLDYDRLHASSIAQLEILVGRVRDKEGFLLASIDGRMNLFDLCGKLDLGSAFIIENKEALMPIINESIMAMYRRHKSGAEVKSVLAGEILDVVCGTHKIVLARLLGEKLSPAGFTKGEIEAAFDCSVRVFPPEYLATNEFDCSCTPLLEVHQCDVEALLRLYRQTKLEDAVFYITSVEPMKRLILSLSDHEALRKYAKVKQRIEHKLAGGAAGLSEAAMNTIRLVWHVFYYKLRGRAAEPAVPGEASLQALWMVDYGLVFEHFFSREFIRFLAEEN